MALPRCFPADPSQWSDLDGDGWGDNSSSEPFDAFPSDPTQQHGW